jgi:hypothetical protein
VEKEIGSVPDRYGFDVHVDGQDIYITQCTGCTGDDCENDNPDVVVLHVSDAGTLISLLGEGINQAIANREDAEVAKATENCTDNGPHCPDGTCCKE